MPSVQKTKIFQVPIKKLYQTIIDVEKYPKFVPGVHGIKVLEKSQDVLKVEYQLNIIKSFKYIIEMKLSPETHVSWSLLEGDIFKKNTGSWTLKAINADQTEAIYSLDVEFKIFAPSMIVSTLVGSNLPQVLDAFEKQAREN
jgi:coenzyme Q-binding protein COQ10